jgi:hypothetical protein
MHRAALFAGVMLIAPEAHATTVKLMSLLEKTEASPVVVHGVIERVESRWAVFGARVETIVTLSVLESIKGNVPIGERLTFRQGGGTVEGFTQTAPGLSVFEEGEEVIMFLEPYLETFVPIGIGIGEYEVRRIGREKYVFHDPKVAAVRYGSDQPMRIEPHPRMEPETLAKFLERVRSYARGDR